MIDFTENVDYKKINEKHKEEWNWIAFLFPGIWAISNRVWGGLLAFIPIPLVNLIIRVVLGLKGNTYTYRYFNGTDEEFYKRKVNYLWGIVISILISTAIASPRVISEYKYFKLERSIFIQYSEILETNDEFISSVDYFDQEKVKGFALTGINDTYNGFTSFYVAEEIFMINGTFSEEQILKIEVRQNNDVILSITY
jgi:hypothetical protein